jgi:hypothetical protein
MRTRKRGEKILFFDELRMRHGRVSRPCERTKQQYVTDQIHTMDGQKRILDLKYHQTKVTKERN